MDVKNIVWIVLGFMVFTSTAHALECDVGYQAKRVTTVTKWYGTWEKPEFKSGTLSGEGKNRKLCAKDALKSVERDGWKIIKQRVIRVYK